MSNQKEIPWILSIKNEGDYSNAYIVTNDPQGYCELIGSINGFIASRFPQINEQWLEVMKIIYSEVVHDMTGQYPVVIRQVIKNPSDTLKGHG